MIEGLKSIVKGDDLKALLAAQMARIKSKHALLKRQADAMKEAAEQAAEELGEQENPYSNTSNNPKVAARDRLKIYAKQLEELAFIHDHIVVEETYQLDRSDLAMIGVADEYHAY